MGLAGLHRKSRPMLRGFHLRRLSSLSERLRSADVAVRHEAAEEGSKLFMRDGEPTIRLFEIRGDDCAR